jgi:hypothetical protein
MGVTMRNLRPFAVLSIALTLADPVLAEAPVAETPLWSAIPHRLPAIDVDPARPGVEILTVAEACTISPTDTAGLLTVSNEIKIKIYSADGKQVVLAPTTSNTVKSGKFPDPRLSRFQCSGANITNYRAQFPGADADSVSQGSGVPVGPGAFHNACAPHTFEADFALCDELPVRTFGVVAAKVGAERVVLLAQAINLQYHNNLSPDDVNASGFSITAYALDGTQLWTRAFKGADSSGYTYIGNLASVGDFLGSDGNDEIRLVAVSDAAGGFRYTYINPLTGANIRVATVAPPTL